KSFKSQLAIQFLVAASICLFFCSTSAIAQREYTVVKPRERSDSEGVTIRTKAGQSSKGVLAVVLQPVVPGVVVVKDSKGKIIGRQDGINDGQAEFQLLRGKTYQVEASYPGYQSVSGKSKPLKANEIIRLNLVPQFVRFTLDRLPAGAQVSIDDKVRATVGQNGAVSIGEIEPGKHTLHISHPEYNDYTDNFDNERLEAGTEINYSRIRMTRVAKLTIKGTAGATVMINGAVQGKIQHDGTVRIDYELEGAAERTISVELLGYQTWTKTELLSPGPRTIEVKLDPIVTSAGVSDGFDSLSQWKTPASGWELAIEGRNKKLRVKGAELGLLKDKVYRDIQKESNFTIWLEDGKGATWAAKADNDGSSYYLFHLAGPKSTTHTPKKFYTYVVSGGTPVEVSTPFPVFMELDQKTSYLINIEISEDKILHWITSNETGQQIELGVWTDTTATKDRFLYGTFGFRSLAGEVFAVDDFNLEPKKQQ
ncbi:MAG: hypothetical protein AAB401_24825, partial [Acidobacteriota bacterium]